MISTSKLYKMQVMDGDLSGNIEFPEALSNEKDVLMDKVMKSLGDDAFNRLNEIICAENDAYMERAYKQGFDDCLGLHIK